MVSKPRLHSCKTERFKITLPPIPVEEKGIVDEAIWLMRKHFFRRFPESVWNRLKAEIKHISDPGAAVSTLMSKFGCPYSRYIPKSALTSRQRNIKGEMGTTGIDLGRRWLPLTEIMQSFVEWVSALSRPMRFDADFFDVGEKSVAELDKRMALLAGMKFVFDTVTPLTVASLARHRRGQACLGTNSKASWMLTAPVCRMIYSACILFAILTSTCRLIGVACPVQVMSLTVPSEAPASTNVGGTGASPAFGAQGATSLQRGDIISHVNGERVRALWSSRRVLRKLNDGDVGSAVRVGVRRPERNSIEKGGHARSSGSGTRSRSMNVVVERHAELISNVHSRLLPSRQGTSVGYLSIAEFSEKTRQEVEDAIASMQRQVVERAECEKGTTGGTGRAGDAPPHLRGLVIDLRGNPGGPIGSAFDLASLFLGSGTILSRTCTHRERKSDLDGDMVLSDAVEQKELKKMLRQSEAHKSLNTRPNKKTNLLLVMDRHTASASEIMIAALTTNKRAVSMGTPTKGKNVAQALVQMSDGSGLAFTIREYRDPKGGFMGDGCIPDIPLQGMYVQGEDLVSMIKHHGGDEWECGY